MRQNQEKTVAIKNTQNELKQQVKHAEDESQTVNEIKKRQADILQKNNIENTESFQQKSLSLRQEFQIMNDKLFETDKLIQMHSFYRIANQKNLPQTQFVQDHSEVLQPVQIQNIEKDSSNIDSAGQQYSQKAPFQNNDGMVSANEYKNQSQTLVDGQAQKENRNQKFTDKIQRTRKVSAQFSKSNSPIKPLQNKQTENLLYKNQANIPQFDIKNKRIQESKDYEKQMKINNSENNSPLSENTSIKQHTRAIDQIQLQNKRNMNQSALEMTENAIMLQNINDGQSLSILNNRKQLSVNINQNNLQKNEPHPYKRNQPQKNDNHCLSGDDVIKLSQQINDLSSSSLQLQNHECQTQKITEKDQIKFNESTLISQLQFQKSLKQGGETMQPAAARGVQTLLSQDLILQLSNLGSSNQQIQFPQLHQLELTSQLINDLKRQILFQKKLEIESQNFNAQNCQNQILPGQIGQDIDLENSNTYNNNNQSAQNDSNENLQQYFVNDQNRNSIYMNQYNNEDENQNNYQIDNQQQVQYNYQNKEGIKNIKPNAQPGQVLRNIKTCKNMKQGFQTTNVEPKMNCSSKTNTDNSASIENLANGNINDNQKVQSLLTTNNNSRKSMLLDHKKIDINSGGTSNYATSMLAKSQSAYDGQILKKGIYQAYQQQKMDTVLSNQETSIRSNQRSSQDQRYNNLGVEDAEISPATQSTGHQYDPNENYQNPNRNFKSFHYYGGTVSSRNLQKDKAQLLSNQNQDIQQPLTSAVILDRSSRSNITNTLTINGKSEPICSDVETQRQTVITNFAQFNQERLNDIKQNAINSSRPNFQSKSNQVYQGQQNQQFNQYQNQVFKQQNTNIMLKDQCEENEFQNINIEDPYSHEYYLNKDLNEKDFYVIQHNSLNNDKKNDLNLNFNINQIKGKMAASGDFGQNHYQQLDNIQSEALQSQQFPNEKVVFESTHQQESQNDIFQSNKAERKLQFQQKQQTLQNEKNQQIMDLKKQKLFQQNETLQTNNQKEIQIFFENNGSFSNNNHQAQDQIQYLQQNQQFENYNQNELDGQDSQQNIIQVFQNIDNNPLHKKSINSAQQFSSHPYNTSYQQYLQVPLNIENNNSMIENLNHMDNLYSKQNFTQSKVLHNNSYAPFINQKGMIDHNLNSISSSQNNRKDLKNIIISSSSNIQLPLYESYQDLSISHQNLQQKSFTQISQEFIQAQNYPNLNQLKNKKSNSQLSEINSQNRNKSNHEQIMEQIKLQNQRSQSQKSVISEQLSVRKSQAANQYYKQMRSLPREFAHKQNDKNYQEILISNQRNFQNQQLNASQQDHTLSTISNNFNNHSKSAQNFVFDNQKHYNVSQEHYNLNKNLKESGELKYQEQMIPFIQSNLQAKNQLQIEIQKSKYKRDGKNIIQQKEERKDEQVNEIFRQSTNSLNNNQQLPELIHFENKDLTAQIQNNQIDKSLGQSLVMTSQQVDSQNTYGNIQNLLTKHIEGSLVDGSSQEILQNWMIQSSFNTESLKNQNMLKSLQRQLFLTQQSTKNGHQKNRQSRTQAATQICSQVNSLEGELPSISGTNTGKINDIKNEQKYVINGQIMSQNLENIHDIKINDPRNLRNFFIQSSITFNGNNHCSVGPQNSHSFNGNNIHQGTYGTYQTNQGDSNEDQQIISENNQINSDYENQGPYFDNGGHLLNDSKQKEINYGNQNDKIEIWDGAYKNSMHSQNSNQNTESNNQLIIEDQNYIQNQQFIQQPQYQNKNQNTKKQEKNETKPQIFESQGINFKNENLNKNVNIEILKITKDHTRSNSQTNNDNSQSQITQSQSQSKKGFNQVHFNNKANQNMMFQKKDENLLSQSQNDFHDNQSQYYQYIQSEHMNVQDFIDNGYTQEQYEMFINQQKLNQIPNNEYNYNESSLQNLLRIQNDNQIQRQKQMQIEKSTRTASRSNSLRRFEINENQQLKLRQSTDSILQNMHSQISEHNVSQIFTKALEPQNIFDLPQALIYIQTLMQQIQDLQQNAQDARNAQKFADDQVKMHQIEYENIQKDQIDQQEHQIQLEQQIFQLVEQRSNLRRQLFEFKKSKNQNASLAEGFEDPDEQNDMNQYFINELQQQIKNLESDNIFIKQSYETLENQIGQLQDIVEQKNAKIEHLENFNSNNQIEQYQGINYQQKEISQQIEYEIHIKKLKQKYKQKQIEKQKEIDEIKAHEAERDKWIQLQYNHIQVLSSQVEQAWRILLQKLDNHEKNQNSQIKMNDNLQENDIQNIRSWIPQEFENETYQDKNEQLKMYQVNGSFGAQSRDNFNNHEQLIENNSSQELKDEFLQSQKIIQSTSQKSQITDSNKQNTSIIEDQDNIYADQHSDRIIKKNKTKFEQNQVHESLAPVTHEIEKLRNIITNLTDHLVNNISQNENKNHVQKNKMDVKFIIDEIKQVFQQNPKQNQDINNLQQVNSDLKIQNSHLQIKLTEQKQQINLIENRLTSEIEKYNKALLQMQRKNEIENQDINIQLIKKNKQTQKQLKQTIRKLEDELMKEKINSSRTELLGKQSMLDSTNKYELQLKNMRQCFGYMLGKVGVEKENVPKWLHEKLKVNYEQLLLTLNNQELLKSMKAYDDKIDYLKSKSKLNQAQDHQDQNLVNENQQLLKILGHEQKLRRSLLNQLQGLKGNIRVVCRVKPVFKSEKYLNQLDLQIVGNSKIQFVNKVSGQKKSYQFDRIFDHKSKQLEIFDEIESLIHSSLDGYNVCIMSYGQTGSGKTFTMVGNDQNPGLYFNAVEEIGRQMKQNKKNNIELDMSVSAIEIYNEEIRDLLTKNQNQNRLRLLEDQDGHVYSSQVKRKVSCKNNILQALRDACFNRTVGVTQFNEYSSRSHFIFTIYITKYNKLSKQIHQGKLSLVDLAGSERILKTNAEGIRIKEAQNINQSLTSLGNVFLHLSNKSSHIPYRDSNLTHYLKDSIGGNAKTMMVLNISQLEQDVGETMSTLVFGQRVQQIQKGSLVAKVRDRSQSNNISTHKYLQLSSQRKKMKNNSRSCVSFTSNKQIEKKKTHSLNGKSNKKSLKPKSLSKAKHTQRQQTENNSISRFNRQKSLNNSICDASKKKAKIIKKQFKNTNLQDEIQQTVSILMNKNEIENGTQNFDTTLSKSVLKSTHDLKKSSKSSRPLKIQDLTTSKSRKRLLNYSPQTQTKDEQDNIQGILPNDIQNQDKLQPEKIEMQNSEERQIININAVGQHFKYQSQSVSDIEKFSDKNRIGKQVLKEYCNNQDNIVSLKSMITNSQIDQKYCQMNTQNTVSQRSFISSKLMNDQSNRVNNQHKLHTQNYNQSIFEMPENQMIRMVKKYESRQDISDLSSGKSLKSNYYQQQKNTKYSTQLNSEYGDKNDENNSKSINQTMKKSPNDIIQYKNDFLKEDVINSYYKKQHKQNQNNGLQKEYIYQIDSSLKKDDNIDSQFKSNFQNMNTMNQDIYQRQYQNWDEQQNLNQPLPKSQNEQFYTNIQKDDVNQKVQNRKTDGNKMKFENENGQFKSTIERQTDSQKGSEQQLTFYVKNRKVEDSQSSQQSINLANKKQLMGELEQVKQMLKNIDNHIISKAYINQHN